MSSREDAAPAAMSSAADDEPRTAREIAGIKKGTNLASAPSMRFGALVLFAGLLTTFGCSAHGDAPPLETTNVAECDSYVAAYRTCLTHLGPGAGTAIDKRVEATRAAFVAKAHDPADRARVAQMCATGLTHLKSSCL